MSKHLTVLGMAILLICMGLSGCEEENSNNGKELDRFVGTWTSEESGGTYNFSSDGIFSFNAINEEYEGIYEVEDEILWFTYTFPSELQGGVEGFDYSFSNNDTTFVISPVGYPEFAIVFLKQ